MSLVMNSKILKRTIDIAKAMCPLNIEHRCSHMAFLIRCGKIVHIGTNSCKSHPKTLEYDYKNHQLVGLHAELNACMKSGREDLRDFKMIVLRVDRMGKLNNKASRAVVVKVWSSNLMWVKCGIVMLRVKL